MTTFTLIHVGISLMAIISGFVVVSGMLTAKGFDGWTAVFLATTILTSLTGFFFPFHGITPAIVLGIISLVVLAVAICARYPRKLTGAWRKTYAIGALLVLYFNVFVLIVQAFQKISALKEVAPTQNDRPFKVTQLIVLVAFIALGILAATRFCAKPLSAPVQKKQEMSTKPTST